MWRVQFFCSFQEVLPGCCYWQLNMGYDKVEVAGAVQTEYAFHGARALLDPEAVFGDEVAEPVLG